MNYSIKIVVETEDYFQIYVSNLGGDYVFIDWGDDSTDFYDEPQSHDYSDGQYIITIYNVTSIGANFLSFTEMIKSVEISVPQIGQGCLSECDNLEEIILHSNVENIGTGFASSCPNLRDVYMLSNIPPLIANGFLDSNDEANIYVLNTQAYQSANPSYTYQQIPIFNSIRYAYKSLKDILQTEYHVAINEEQINVHGFSTLIDKIGDL